MYLWCEVVRIKHEPLLRIKYSVLHIEKAQNTFGLGTKVAIWANSSLAFSGWKKEGPAPPLSTLLLAFQVLSEGGMATKATEAQRGQLRVSPVMTCLSHSECPYFIPWDARNMGHLGEHRPKRTLGVKTLEFTCMFPPMEPRKATEV